MKNATRIFSFVAVLAVALIIGFSATSLLARKKPITDNSHIVRLLTDHADPSAIAITKGDYVQFDSQDGQTHNIGQGSGDDEVHQDIHQDQHQHASGSKESGEFGASQGYRVQINQVGTYTFHDHLHPKISVTVIVYAANK